MIKCADDLINFMIRSLFNCLHVIFYQFLGQVIFYSKRKSTLFAVELILNGEQFASSFGYTILAMDLQNDK